MVSAITSPWKEYSHITVNTKKTIADTTFMAMPLLYCLVFFALTLFCYELVLLKHNC